MVKARIERNIHVPVQEAWNMLGDFSHIHFIHPSVKSVDQLTIDQDKGVGAMRLCHFYDGNHAKEKIVEWDESNRTFVVDIIESTMPIQSATGTFHVQDLGNGNTKIVANMEMNAKYGLLGKLMAYLVLKRKLGGSIGDMMAGIEHRYKTGEDVPQGFKAKTPALVT